MRRLIIVMALLVFSSLGAIAGEESAATASEIEALRAQLAAQQEQVRQLQELLQKQAALLAALERRLGAQPAAVSSPGAADDVAQAAPLEERVEKLEQAVDTDHKENEKRWKGLGNFRFSGDLRVRYEPFFQEGTEQRHRERGRLRFQVAADITKELSGGLRFATGELNDPITTNRTFTGFFTRKAFDLDRFWLTYKPQQLGWLTLTAGKFAYPWYRTELTFDNDLNPEGIAETFSFNFSDSPLTNLTLVGFQLPFNEVSSGQDSFIWGGQVQTRWKLSDRARLGLYATGVDFRHPDPIAVAMGNGTLRPSLPLSNFVRVDSSGNILGFAERFAYLDLIAELNYRLTPRWPLRLTFDVVNNLRVAGERTGYYAEAELGDTSEKGNWALGYTLFRIEREAVIGAYSFSDIRASTNVLNHRLHAAYQVHRNVTLEYWVFLGSLFNPQDNLSLVPPAFRPEAKDPLLYRMQIDVIYRF